MSRICYYKDQNFIFEYEIKDKIVAIHCDVFSWKPSSLKHGYAVFGKFLNEMKNNKVTTVITATPNPKFARIFGGETIKSFTDNGQTIEVIKWELD